MRSSTSFRWYHLSDLYTPEWTARRVLNAAALISIIPLYWRLYYFAFITTAGYGKGVVIGELFGGFASDVPSQYPHYGWLLWGGVFILAIITGAVVEVLLRRKRRTTGSNQG